MMRRDNTMSNSDIQNLLVKLRDEIQKAELDAETRSLMQELDSDIHDILDSDKTEEESATVLKRAQAFEAKFETEHPTTVRVLGELIEALARMGI